MFRSKLVVAILLLILATVLVGCNGSTAVVISPTVEKSTATQVPPTATQEPTSTATPAPMEFEAALELVSQDCRELPELEALPIGADEWFAVDSDKVWQYSIELLEQIESEPPDYASYTIGAVMWHYVPNTNFCWASSISFDEIEEQLLVYETEAGEIVVLPILPIKLNEKSVVWLDEDPIRLRAALELVSQDCREIPELEAYADARGTWFAVDSDKVGQYSLKLFEQIESGLPVDPYTVTFMWHYAPSTEFCWAVSISSDETEEQLLAYETEAGEIVVFRFNEEPVVWLDEDAMELEAALELVSQDCREIPELEAYADARGTWFAVDFDKVSQYGLELLNKGIESGLPPPSHAATVIMWHYAPSTKFCWAASYISPDKVEEQFLVYETSAGEIVVLPILPIEFDLEWWLEQLALENEGLNQDPGSPLESEELDWITTVTQDCQELYDFEGNVIDEKPLDIGDLLMRSGFMKAGGREPDWESGYIRTDVGECLVVEVTDDTGARFVVYKAKDGEVKTLKTEE